MEWWTDIILVSVKMELDEMEKTGIIAKVETPTEWVNSLVVVEKANGQ